MESKPQQQRGGGQQQGQARQQKPRGQGRTSGRGGGRGGRGGNNNNNNPPRTHYTQHPQPSQPPQPQPQQPQPQPPKPQPQHQPQQPQQSQEGSLPEPRYYESESQTHQTSRRPRPQSQRQHATSHAPQGPQHAPQTEIRRPSQHYSQVAPRVSQQGPPQQFQHTHQAQAPHRSQSYREPRQQGSRQAQQTQSQQQRPPRQSPRKPRYQQQQQQWQPHTPSQSPPTPQIQQEPPQQTQQPQQQQPQEPQPQQIEEAQQPLQTPQPQEPRPQQLQQLRQHEQRVEQGEIMKRPPSGQDRSGRQLRLVCNHFSFLLARTPIFQYSVEFTPECDSKKTRFTILQKHKEESIGCAFVFDGAMLFTVAQIKELEFKDTFGDREITVSITFTKVLQSEAPNPPEQLYNMLFKKVLRALKLKQIGKQHFDPRKSIAIPQHKVELWPGYFTSIGPNKMGSMLIADVTHKILRTDSVLDFIYQLIDAGGNWRAKASQELLGQIVLTRYNNRTYRIDEIDWDKTPQSTFVKRNGEHMTFQAYYASTYNKGLTDLEQPLLISRFRKKGAPDEIIYLIPELCSMTGLTDKMRKDFRVMQDIAAHTRVNPGTRATEVLSFVQSINTNQEINEELAEWKIDLDPKMLAVQGRVLPAETIMFAGEIKGQSPDWSHQTKNARLIHPVGLTNWILVCSERNATQAREFAEKLKTVGASVGFKVERPTIKSLRNDNTAAFSAAIRDGLKAQPGIEFVVCILPSATKDRYDEIKRICCVDLPVPSQCLLAKSMNKNVMSVCSKIMMQINCKLGGELWNLQIPISNTMVIGIDVYHDTNTRGGKRSVAGFCASINKSFTRYFSRVTFQGRGQELVSGLQSCLHDALRAYFARNDSLPERIIVYRDGVGDGMLDAVVAHEIPQFRATFKAIDEKYNPKMAFVVVKKRIHTRLFLPDARSSALSNPPPGTVVDSGCVHPDWYDFFLVSQSVRQGTVTPSHYHVIADNTGLQPDQMQVLTYKMCHLYYNWPGTIRVPAPCQYAHKIAFLVGQSLHQDPAPALRDKLYFL